jgi:hypothetical protein
MKEIRLTRGQVALVDDEDFEWLSRRKWSALKRSSGTGFYAVRVEQKSGRQSMVYMHRAILDLAHLERRIADHADGNTLNNQRRNLRVATWTQNAANKFSKPDGSTSRFKGVSRAPKGDGWVAHCQKQHIGSFGCERAAAEAYDADALRRFGEFALTNKKAGLL